MKNIILLCALFLLISCNNLNINQYASMDSYKVVKIEEYSKYFIIKVERNDSLFKIVSAKDCMLGNNQGNQIRINKLYKLNLKPRNERNDNIFLVNYLDVQCYGYEDTTICYEEDCIPELYYAKNLKGLHLIDENE